MILVLVLEWDRGDSGRYEFRIDVRDPSGNLTLSVGRLLGGQPTARGSSPTPHPAHDAAGRRGLPGTGTIRVRPEGQGTGAGGPYAVPGRGWRPTRERRPKSRAEPGTEPSWACAPHPDDPREPSDRPGRMRCGPRFRPAVQNAPNARRARKAKPASAPRGGFPFLVAEVAVEGEPGRRLPKLRSGPVGGDARDEDRHRFAVAHEGLSEVGPPTPRSSRSMVLLYTTKKNTRNRSAKAQTPPATVTPRPTRKLPR